MKNDCCNMFHKCENHGVFLFLSFIFMAKLSRQETSTSPCIIKSGTCHCITGNSDQLYNDILFCCQPEVLRIHLEGDRVQKLHSNAFYHSPCHNLIGIHIHDTNIDSNQQGLPGNGLAFTGLPNLESLQLTGNAKVTSLPNSVFSGLNIGLKLLNLSGNVLRSINGDEFQGLISSNSQLFELDLSNNRIVTLAARCFLLLKSEATNLGIRRLNLAKNNLLQLQPNIFEGLENLEYLDIRNNPIEIIIGGTFRKLSKLRQLFLSGSIENKSYTGLKHITPALLHGLYSLNKLSLSRLQISTIDDDSFLEVRQLRELDLSGNHLSSIPFVSLNRLAINQRSRLQLLNLSQNQITCLPHNVFSKLIRLKILDLRENKITVISGDAFHGLGGLRELNLLNNPLQIISANAFEQMSTDKNFQIVHQNSDYPPNLFQLNRIPSQETTIRLPGDALITNLEGTGMPAYIKTSGTLTKLNLSDVYIQQCPQVSVINYKSPTTDELVSSTEHNISQLQLAHLLDHLTNNKLTTIFVTICTLLGSIAAVVITLTCRHCQRKDSKSKTTKKVINSEMSSSQYILSKNQTFNQGCLNSFSTRRPFLCCDSGEPHSYNEIGQFDLKHERTATLENMTTSERLFSLGQHLTPPPYPHNMETVSERLLRTVEAKNMQSSLTNYPNVFQKSFHLQENATINPNRYFQKHKHETTCYRQAVGSGNSSPNFSNISNSSPGYSSSSVPVNVDRVLPSERRKLNKPSNSPLHESGIVSDNTSSLVTALGIF